RPRGNLLSGGEALGMPLQTFDTEEFLANGILSIPRRSSWTSSESAKDRRYQVGLSAAAARDFSRQARLANARCRNAVRTHASVTLRGNGSELGGDRLDYERSKGTAMD